MKTLSYLINLINLGKTLSKKQVFFSLPLNKMTKEFLQILLNEGFIKNYQQIIKQSKLVTVIEFRFSGENKNIIRNIKFIGGNLVSSQIQTTTLWKKQRGEGVFILSTPKGLLTDQQARFNNLSGLLVAVVI